MNKHKNYIPDVLKVGFPLLAGNLSHYLLQLADTAMVGQLGQNPLAAIAMAGLFTGIIYTFVWPISVGVQAISSRRFGIQQDSKDKPELAYKTGEVMDNGIIVGLLAGLLGVIVSFSSSIILSVLIETDELLPLAQSYINIIKIGLPVFGMSVAFHGFLAAVKKTQDIMISTLAANILNIFFNYIFIFGKFGFPAMGIKGAALGTVLAQFFGVLYLLIRVLRPELKNKYNYFHFSALDKKMQLDIVKVSWPIGVQNGIALFIFLTFDGIIESISAAYLAATHVVFSVFRVNKTIIGGFARGAAILVGNAIGADNKKEAKKYVFACQKISVCIGFFIMISCFFFPEFIVRIFTKDVEVIGIGIDAIRFFAVFFFIEVIGYSFEIVFTNNGWGKYVLFSEFTTNILFILGFTLLGVYVLNMEIMGAWLGFALYQIFHALILTSGYISGKWLHVKVES
jgi:MATE family multidrug resistance protein